MGPDEGGQVLLGIMSVVHAEPTASAFTRLLKKRLEGDDAVLLAHVFEEASVLALHRQLSEELLFDAFALDMYWDELREDIVRLRRSTGNNKLGENFEIAAERAREHRRRVPTKLRWRPDDQQPPGGGGGRGGRPPEPEPRPGAPVPEPAPPGARR